MRNYFVNPVQTEDNDFLWCVIERKTNQIIDSLQFEEDANEYCDFLNLGGAFDGDTPRFILTRILPSHLNRDFSAVFSE